MFTSCVYLLVTKVIPKALLSIKMQKKNRAQLNNSLHICP